MYVATTLRRSSPRFLEEPWCVVLLFAVLADAPEGGWVVHAVNLAQRSQGPVAFFSFARFRIYHCAEGVCQGKAADPRLQRREADLVVLI